MSKEQLTQHLNNFILKELKDEIMKFKWQFAVSKMKRHEVEQVILQNYDFFYISFKHEKEARSKKTEEEN